MIIADELRGAILILGLGGTRLDAIREPRNGLRRGDCRLGL